MMESRFRGDVRYRGIAYLKAERVTISRVTADEVTAVVRDGVEYRTQVTRDDGQLKMFCSCIAGNAPEAACKHLWATILAVEEAGYVTGSLKPGYIPPFAFERDASPRLGFWGVDEDFADDELAFADPARRSAAPVAPQRPWEARLDELRRQLEANQPRGAAAAREREIFYEIDLAQSRAVGQLVVQTSQRQRRGNGQWGKLKPFKLRPGRLDDVELSEDARILAYL
jgi:hypothetical protein